MDNDHIKQRRNKSYLWFHRFQYDTSMYIFISYNLQVAGIAEMAFTWTQQNPLRVQPCKTIYLVSKLHPKCHDIWLKLSLPIFRLDFETCCFLPSFQCFLVGKKVVEPLQIGIFFTWELDHDTQAFSRWNIKLPKVSLAAVSHHFIFPCILVSKLRARRSHTSHEIMLFIISGPIKK